MKNILGSLSNLSLPFGGNAKQKEVLAFELVDQRVKLACAKVSGEQSQVQWVETEVFEPEADVAISAYLNQTAKKRRVKSREVICIIPPEGFISKNVDMPSNKEEEIAKIIELQAGRFTPYSQDEIVIDYLCHELKGQHYTNVLLFIVHRRIIDRYINLVEMAGMHVGGFRVSCEGIVKGDAMEKMLKAADTASGCIHVGEQSSNFMLMDQSDMIFIRTIPVGFEQFHTTLKEAEGTFVEELNKSLAAYQDQGMGRQIKDVVLCGIDELSEKITQILKDQVTLFKDAGITIKSFNYRQQYSFEKAAAEMIDKHTEISYLDILGPLCSIESLKLDLMPKEIIERKKIRKQGAEMVKTGTLVMTLFLMISFLLVVKIHFKSVLLDQLDAINASSFKEARDLERISTKSRAVRSLLDSRGKGLYVFDKITALLGSEVYLVEFSYDEEGNIILKGTADSMSRVFSLVNQFEESKYFSTLTTNETKTRREGNKEVADFSLEGKLSEDM